MTPSVSASLFQATSFQARVSAQQPNEGPTAKHPPQHSRGAAAPSRAEAPMGYRPPSSAEEGAKAGLQQRAKDIMSALKGLRDGHETLSDSPLLIGAGKGEATVWDSAGVERASIRLGAVSYGDGDMTARAAFLEASFSFSDGSRLSASFATASASGYGEISVGAVTYSSGESRETVSLEESAPGKAPGANGIAPTNPLPEDFMPDMEIHAEAQGEAKGPATITGLFNIGGTESADAIRARAQFIIGLFGGAGNDAISAQGAVVAGLDAGEGNDVISVSAKMGINLFAGLGDDIMHVEGDVLRNIGGGGGDDLMVVKGRDIANVQGGAGNDSMHILGDKAAHVNGGAGDDIIALWSKQGSLDVTPGGGKDIVTLGEGGEYAINVAPELAQLADDIGVEALGGGALRLTFKDGSQTTLLGADKAASLKLGNDGLEIDLKEALKANA